MSTSTLISLDDFDRMIASGAFEPPHHRRCELIRGEIRDLSPIGPRHGEIVSVLNGWSHTVTARKGVRIRVQDSIGISDLGSAPEPDIVWAAAKSYVKRRPEPADVLLLIKVAQSSLRYDLGAKANLYAEAGATDYWVIDIPRRRVHIHRDPAPDGCRSVVRVAAGDVVQPVNVANATLDVAELFACLE